MSEKFPYSVVEKLSFIRYGGTDEEMRAANIIAEEIRAMGGSAELTPFEVPAGVVKKAEIRVPEAARAAAGDSLPESIETIPFELSGNLPEGGVDLKLFYADRAKKEDYYGVKELSDSIVMINELDVDAYKLLVEKKAAAFMTINGKHYDDMHSSNLYHRALRPHFLEKGVIPGFMILAKDAIKLLAAGVETLHVTLEQEEEQHPSRNVVAVIEGTEMPEESIVLTAHYDSVPVGTGSWDNATGSAALLYIYRYFLQNAPKRTMKFIWCGSEEQGLLGSKAYVAQHEDELDAVKFCFNFDMCGSYLGPNMIFITGDEKLETFAKQYCREKGYSSEFRTCVHSSDSAPFCDKGIPALGLSRGMKGGEIHTWHDTIEYVSPEMLEKNSAFFTSMIERVVNSAEMPVDKGMNDDMKKELDKYFKREKKEALHEEIT